MNAIAGPRSRCPSRYRKSLTISPRVSRYQFSAARNRVVPSTTCPSRWISAGLRWGRWVPLTRTGPAPKFSASGARSGTDGNSVTPWTTRTGNPLGSRSATTWPPECAATEPVEVIARGGLVSGAGETGVRAPADDQARRAGPSAAQQQRLRRPVGDREAEVGTEPLGCVQVRLLELQPRQAGHLDQRILRPPGVLPGHGTGLAVQRTVRVFPRSPRCWGLARAQMCRHDRFPHSHVLDDLISFVIYYQL